MINLISYLISSPSFSLSSIGINKMGYKYFMPPLTTCHKPDETTTQTTTTATGTTTTTTTKRRETKKLNSTNWARLKFIYLIKIYRIDSIVIWFMAIENETSASHCSKSGTETLIFFQIKISKPIANRPITTTATANKSTAVSAITTAIDSNKCIQSKLIRYVHNSNNK